MFHFVVLVAKAAIVLAAFGLILVYCYSLVFWTITGRWPESAEDFDE